MPSGQAAEVKDNADGGEADERADGAAEEVGDANAVDGGAPAMAGADGGGEGVREDAVEATDTHVGETGGQSQARRVSPNPANPSSTSGRGNDTIERMKRDIAKMREEDEELNRQMKKWVTWGGIALGGIVVGYILAAATESPVEDVIDRMIPG